MGAVKFGTWIVPNDLTEGGGGFVREFSMVSLLYYLIRYISKN